MWTLEDAQKLVGTLQSTMGEFGYFLTIAGDVMNKGKSDKCLDVYMLRSNYSYKPATGSLLMYLASIWGIGAALGPSTNYFPPNKYQTVRENRRTCNPFKYELSFTLGKRKLKVFIME